MHLLVLMVLDIFLCLKRLPGNAQAVGSLLDHLKWEEMLGRFAGMIHALLFAGMKHSHRSKRKITCDALKEVT